MQLTAYSRFLSCGKGLTPIMVRIMKITAILVLLAVCLQVSASTNGQTVTLSVKKAPMKEVFREIQKQTGFNVLVNEKILAKVGKVTLEVRNMPVLEVLHLCFRDGQFSYTIVDGTIVVKPVPALVFQPTVSSPAIQLPPPIEVKGRVVNEKGDPIPGVTITVKGTKKMTATDVNGMFDLKGVDQNATLVFSGVNVETVELKVNGKTEFGDISLKIKVTEGEDVKVLVSTGYQTLTKERITGSFSTVGTKELERTISYSIVDKLEGNLTGLLFDPLGVTIRGVSTINSSRLPLVVIDGFPITISKDVNDYADENEFAAFKRALETVNPNDIATITILKDAAAASIWGARAANGVIVITSKHTTSREPIINFSTNLSITPTPDVNKLPYANGETQLKIEKGRYDAGWFDSFIASMYAQNYNVSDYVYTRSRVAQGLQPASDLTALEAQMKSYDNKGDFSRIFMQSAVHQQYNLSVNQAAAFNNYRFSASFDQDRAVMKQNDLSRVVLNLSNQFRPVPWLALNFGSNLTLRNEKANGVQLSELYNILPHQAFEDANGNYTSQTSFNTTLSYGRPFREAYYNANPWLPYDWEYNLKREFDNKDNTIKTTDLRLSGGITIKPFKDMLTIDMKYQYEQTAVRTDNMYNTQMWDTRMKINTFAQPNGTLPVPKGNIFDQIYGTSRAHDVLLTGNFYKNFAQRHQVTLLGGAEVRDELSDKSNSRRYGFNPQTLTWANQMDYHDTYPRNMFTNNSAYYIESSFSTIMDYWFRQDRYVSTFANFSYTLDNKYDVTGSWRIDKSNMFGQSPKYRQTPLWSTGVGWTISKESFFDVKFVDRLRFRATYGSSGNVDKSTSPYAIATVGGSQTNSTLQLPAGQITNPANTELRWETTRQFNAGVEFSLFNNRIYGEIEYYNKVGNDLLATKKINSTLGFNQAMINFGGMKNTGVDINISATVLQKPLTWRTEIMQSFNRNRVTKTNKVNITQIGLSYFLQPDPSNRIQEGKPRYYILSIPWAGLSANGVPQFMYNGKPEDALTSTVPATTLAYGYQNLIYEGPTQAPIYGSWNNTFNYKQFELSFLATYKFGHVYLHTSPFRVINNDLYGFAQGNLVPHYAKEFENMWTQPGDENHTNIPRLPFEYTGTSARSKTGWYNYAVNYGSHQVMNAATIRLQRVTLSYALKKSWLPNQIKGIKVMAQARNLHTFTFNKYHEDPERLPDMMGNFLLSSRAEYTFSILASF